MFLIVAPVDQKIKEYEKAKKEEKPKSEAKAKADSLFGKEASLSVG